MRVTLKLFASLQDRLPLADRVTGKTAVELPTGATVADLIASQGLPEKSCHLVLVDGVYVAPDERVHKILHEGTTVAIWPPVAGG